MLDLSKYPVVDSHCHAFLPDKETDPFEKYLNLAIHPIPKFDMVNTFIYHQVTRELSRVLGVKGTGDDIIEERNRRYRKDPAGYIRTLFEDAAIDTLLVDTGYPSEEFSGYSIDLREFSKLVPCKVREIYRIDNLLYNIINEQLPFNEAVEKFHNQIKNAIKNGAVGLKSVIAYRTGLEVQRHDDSEAKEMYNGIVDEVKGGKEAKNVLSRKSKPVKTALDYFMIIGVSDSVKLKVPFQIHVGMGDAPIIDLRVANPILLHDLINDKSAKESKLVLTHGGYPYVEEAGFLVNTYPNVFLDFSETIPFISVGIKNKLLNLFEMAPTTKIMYGSDGYNVPELHWFSSIQTKKALSEALKDLLESEEISEKWALKIAEQFLSENAKRIYKL